MCFGAIKDDIIKANKALRKTNMLTELTPRGLCSQLPNGSIANNVKESDAQALFIRRHERRVPSTEHSRSWHKFASCYTASVLLSGRRVELTVKYCSSEDAQEA